MTFRKCNFLPLKKNVGCVGGDGRGVVKLVALSCGPGRSLEALVEAGAAGGGGG